MADQNQKKKEGRGGGGKGGRKGGRKKGSKQNPTIIFFQYNIQGPAEVTPLSVVGRVHKCLAQDGQ